MPNADLSTHHDLHDHVLAWLRANGIDPTNIPEDCHMTHLDAVVVRPGDTLIVRVPSTLTQEQFTQIVTHLDERLPGVKTVLLGVDQILVYRPDGDES
jgi:hypothetical protein